MEVVPALTKNAAWKWCRQQTKMQHGNDAGKKKCSMEMMPATKKMQHGSGACNKSHLAHPSDLTVNWQCIVFCISERLKQHRCIYLTSEWALHIAVRTDAEYGCDGGAGSAKSCLFVSIYHLLSIYTHLYIMPLG